MDNESLQKHNLSNTNKTSIDTHIIEGNTHNKHMLKSIFVLIRQHNIYGFLLFKKANDFMSISSKRQPSRVCGDIRGLITNKSHISSQCNET